MAVVQYQHEERRPEALDDNLKKNQHGIVLVPQPSDSPMDPLNWSQFRKVSLLTVVCILAFITQNAVAANNGGYFAQAAAYNTSVTDISYSLSAGIAGDVTGPLLWTPLSRKFGRSFMMLWGTLISTVCLIWSALMTGKDDYIPFVLSRLFGAIFCSVVTTLGASVIMDILFLHQRGKAFSAYGLSVIMGTVTGPVFSGFIVNSSPWPIQYWYNVGLQAFAVILILIFMEETSFPRPGSAECPKQPESYWARRKAIFFMGYKYIPYRSWREIGTDAMSQMYIAISPVTMMPGTFLLFTFSWSIAISVLVTIYLQSPVTAGGYGFSPMQNACFYFASWVAVIVGEIYGASVSDRLPLYLCKRFGDGVWKPEWRLHCLWLPSAVALPIGLGIFGAALQYHLHYMVLALGTFLVNTTAIVSVPILVTYVVENFTNRAAEVAFVLGFYRALFGLSLPFFIFDWQAAVGVGWLFGMMGFISLVMFGLLVILMSHGHKFRSYTFAHLTSTEEGMKIEQVHAEKQAADRQEVCMQEEVL